MGKTFFQFRANAYNSLLLSMLFIPNEQKETKMNVKKRENKSHTKRWEMRPGLKNFEKVTVLIQLKSSV